MTKLLRKPSPKTIKFKAKAHECSDAVCLDCFNKHGPEISFSLEDAKTMNLKDGKTYEVTVSAKEA